MPSASVIVRVTGGGGGGIGGADGRGVCSRRWPAAGPRALRAIGRPLRHAGPLRILTRPRRHTRLLRANRLRGQRTRTAHRRLRPRTGIRRTRPLGGPPRPRHLRGRTDASRAASGPPRRRLPDARPSASRGARLAARGAAPCAARRVGSGGVGVVGRCSSIRRRSVGGTMRPGVGAFAARGGGAARRCSDGRGRLRRRRARRPTRPACVGSAADALRRRGGRVDDRRRPARFGRGFDGRRRRRGLRLGSGFGARAADGGAAWPSSPDAAAAARRRRLRRLGRLLGRRGLLAL